MYLLNIDTQQLEDIQERRPYAILSHAWRVGETHHFHEIGTETVRIQPGYEKVEMCCELARQDGLDYVWIDTCCADANSSAAHTERTISAYTWYQQAQVCYTYLDDVDGSEDPREGRSTFRQSRWFSRAWTLQELLAPKHVFFFAKDWTMIGTKAGLASVISKVTGIHKDALEYPERVPCFSIATRMSWAKGRTTSKEEDRVYALMGLFGVNLPILYGEGETRTFLKLQNEIIKTTDDQSIFAWCSVAGASASSEFHASGLLADNSTYFADCGDVQRIPYDRWSEYCTKHFRSKTISYPQLSVDPSCRGLQATLPVQWRRAGLDALLACTRGPAVWNGSEYVANVNRPDLIRVRLQKSYHGYERRVGEGHLETVGIDDYKKFRLQEIHICVSQPFLGLGVPADRNWVLRKSLYIIPLSIAFLGYQYSHKAFSWSFSPPLIAIVNWFVTSCSSM
ncbi:hypothetical protein BKA83DRAFT_4236765 [Pisolithus microcarpus]|nr:hypothetical protein BKA83DRAFT_4236765 [Pisolithus microcarpus]